MSKKKLPPVPCKWMTEEDALKAFATFAGKTESAEHIKPLHWYVASRLVVEGGFHPDSITPRPPFRVGQLRHKLPTLHFDPAAAGYGERTLLGGLKTKNVDVVVTQDGLGPVLAVSLKGVQGAFRNLTNRMEELIGECTNLHISMPTLVLGYMAILRANRSLEQIFETAVEDAEEELDDDDGLIEGETELDSNEFEKELKANDLAMTVGGDPVEGIIRFHNALVEITGRKGIRNDLSRYEAIAMGLVEMEKSTRGALLKSYPYEDSPLRFEKFFQHLYFKYDERFVVSAPKLANAVGGTRRIEWSPESPAFKELSPDYSPRVGTPKLPKKRAN